MTQLGWLVSRDQSDSGPAFGRRQAHCPDAHRTPRTQRKSKLDSSTGSAHAGYSKYREELVRGGVRLYELKPGLQEKERERLGGSDASLHAKTFSIDRSRIFVGSFNFDPRSAHLNTEMGLLLDSAALAGRLAGAFDEDMQRVAYEVRLTSSGDLEWLERGAAGETRHADEPGTGPLRHAWIWFLSLLPIEWLL